MFTGKHLPGHGVFQLNDILPETEVLFPRCLQELGYQTALFGKLHVGSRYYEAAQRHPNDGFDIYEWCLEGSLHLDSPYNGYARWLRQYPQFLKQLQELGRKLLHVPREVHMTHWAAERTIDYINRWQGAQPFFVMMSVFDPHNPYEDYPEEMLAYVNTDKIPKPLAAPEAIDRRPAGIRHEHTNSYFGAYHDFTPDQFMKMREGYLASVALIDLEVGRVFQALERKGIAEDTLVIFVSDHGDMLGDHELLVKGAFFYDPCTRVPMIMRWPRLIEPGQVCSDLVQPHDLAATILALAGVPQVQLAETMPEAQNLLGLLHGVESQNKSESQNETNPQRRDYAVCCYRNSGICRNGGYFDPPIHATMLRTQQFKLNVYHEPEANGCEGELYDMEADPAESHNLWSDSMYRDIRAQLLHRLSNWQVKQELFR